MILRFLLFAPILAALANCGSGGRTIERDYRLGVRDPDPAVRDAFRNMILEFNEGVGMDALHYVDDFSQASSHIILENGIYDPHSDEPKVAFGEWRKDISIDRSITNWQGDEHQRWTMLLRFDRDWMVSRLLSEEPEKFFESKVTFSHEVGHGIQWVGPNNQVHHPHPNHVMYKKVSTGEKDMQQYYIDVAPFLL